MVKHLVGFREENYFMQSFAPPPPTRHFCFGKSVQNHFRPCAALQRMLKTSVSKAAGALTRAAYTLVRERERREERQVCEPEGSQNGENAVGGFFQHSPRRNDVTKATPVIPDFSETAKVYADVTEANLSKTSRPKPIISSLTPNIVL